ncbi:LOW QUALITY PROTEIN: hypothetical protein PHAVU_009G218400 [Phaseolus vulgaris]
MMQNLIFFIFILIMVNHTTSTPVPPPPSPPRQQVNNILDALIGAGDFSTWVSILSSPNATILPVSATLFVPRDAAVDRPPPDPLLLPYHVVPQRLPFSDLLLLPRRARLPTLLADKTISVTDNSPPTSPSTTPPHPPRPLLLPLPCRPRRPSFLDYSLFGDGLPPPPPFLPGGHTIGSARNPGASSSRLNVVVLVPLFSFVVPLLLS